MPFTTLDVTVSEMIAICDYTNDIDCRCTADFVKGTHCMLCGTVEAGADSALQHVSSKPHQTRIQQYSVCARELLVHERAIVDASAAPASRREVVLAFLGDRIARSEVIRGVGAFNTVAVSFLLKRCRVTELLSAFKDIVGTPPSLSRGLCSVCMEHASSVMFDTCKHICVCGPCSRRLVANSAEGAEPRCPICRVQSQVVPVFIT